MFQVSIPQAKAQNNYRGLPMSINTLKWTPCSMGGKRRGLSHFSRRSLTAVGHSWTRMHGRTQEGRGTVRRLLLPTSSVPSEHSSCLNTHSWTQVFWCPNSMKTIILCFSFFLPVWTQQCRREARWGNPKTKQSHCKMPDFFCYPVTYSRIPFCYPACGLNAFVQRKEVWWEQKSSDYFSCFHLKQG